MMEAVEASLKRLRTDYIDLYWLHIWDFLTPIEEVMRAFDDLVRMGKVLYVGISDAPAWIVSRGQTLAELRGWSPIVALQVEYSLVQRTPERELLPMAEALGMTVTPWSPLAGGVLTGKYTTGQGGDGRYANEGMKQFQSSGQRVDGIVKEVLTIAGECKRSPAQVALAWLRQRPQPTIPIIGARRLDQVKDNLACLTLKLDPSQVERLDRVSAIEMGFPHDFFQRDRVKGIVYAGYRDRIDAKLP
jgi:aryl-alcohol dehydrogenase-like predicted oxidoreductase